MLLYVAQACHELVPPDIIEQLVYVIAQNFVSDRNTPEAVTVGLNTIREIFANCPFAATEDLLRDLTDVCLFSFIFLKLSHVCTKKRILRSLTKNFLSNELN